MDNTLAEQMKQQSSVKRQFEQQTRRIGEIDTIIQRLYEDNVSGKLTDERFSKMSATYEKEQRELEASTSKLREQVDACEQQKVNVKSFRGYCDKSTKRYGWEVVAVTDPNILGLVDLTR